MIMHGAEAVEFEEMTAPRIERERDVQPRFEVVAGGGLDARVRAGVSSEFLARVKMVVAGAILIFVLGSARVALTSLTVAQLSANNQMREQISDYTTSNDNLRVERSLMASASRIDRIAIQNYGMIAPASFDVIVIETEDEEAVEGAQDVAQDAAAPASAEAPVAEEGLVFDTTQLAAGL